MGRISSMAVLTSFFQPFVRFHPQTCKMGPRKTKKLYCYCRQGQKGFMVCCDSCEQWFHGSCVGASKASVKGLDEWFCSHCKWSENKINNQFKKFKADFDSYVERRLEKTEALDQQPNNAEFMQLQQDLKECREKKIEAELQFKRQIENLEQSVKEKDLELSEIKKANVKLALDLTECSQTMEANLQLKDKIVKIEHTVKVKDLELAALKAANMKLTHDLTQCQCSQKIDNLRKSNSIQQKLSKSSTQPAPKEEKNLSIIPNANRKQSSKLSLKKSLSQPQQCPVKKYSDDED
ncbi:Nucleosome-remodeling factor subunit NURF301 [Frankliniella fusca]|uniref:Nucleosome-remodeling factor subunit NURF301 n=1 Tax=Frankliniella fusca TaxID=407009 RepID=A0AAE1H9G4_9NEOP|nr:Nucleosome-remodeling factor subunit NURF301 [Frankliniella fusca]